jgi:hypothetical protein
MTEKNEVAEVFGRPKNEEARIIDDCSINMKNGIESGSSTFAI